MEPADPNAHRLPPFVAPPLSRRERRVLDGRIQLARDLVITRIGANVYVGIVGGGRIRLTAAEARQLAGSLLEISDDEPAPR